MVDDAPLSSAEIERYGRHIVMPEIGGAGQQALKRALVAVIGAGGLGSPVLAYLAAAGVGRLRIIDDDTVALSNLQRQILHGTGDIGRPKTASAAEAIAGLNPHVTVEPVNERITAANAGPLLTGADVVIDGSDSFATRTVVADAAERLGVPLVTGALGRFDGSVTVLHPAGATDGIPNPAWRDLFPQIPEDGTIPTCAQAGVLGALAGLVGSIQAIEAIKLVTGAGEPLVGRLLVIDALSMRMRIIGYRRAS